MYYYYSKNRLYTFRNREKKCIIEKLLFMKNSRYNITLKT